MGEQDYTVGGGEEIEWLSESGKRRLWRVDWKRGKGLT